MNKLVLDINFDKKIIKDFNGYYEVVGIDSMYGVLLSLDSVCNYRDGLRLTKEEEEAINNIYKVLFIK